MRALFALGFCFGLAACSTPPQTRPDHDLIIRNGVIYDGTGAPGRRADVAVDGDRIARVGDLSGATAAREVDAEGLAVSPGFINVLSWATESLLVDGRAMSDVRQGVTLEVMGEGFSYGPLNEAMKADLKASQGDLTYDVAWTSLGDYLEHLEARGVSTNVASFVGATTVRIHELGQAHRAPKPEELARMQALVRAAMEQGALGVGSALIYAPGHFAETEELTALAAAAAEYGGGYTTHLRSEGAGFLEAIEETLEIARRSGAWTQIHHLKPAGERNWDKRDAGVALLEAARAEGLDVTANMYLYTAGATGLDAAMPPWVQEGGLEAWGMRLKDPDVRERVARDMRDPEAEWENLYLEAGGAERVILTGFKNDALKPLTGRTLAQVAELRGVTPEEAAMDLVIEDESRVGAIYFLMSEENVRSNIAWPYMMFGSDGSAPAAEGAFLKSNVHPRAYGNFARLLGRYVREEAVIPLEEAVRRLTHLPATTFRLKNRGRIAPGSYADLVVFDPDVVADRATYEEPHQYALGVRDVVVNGVAVLEGGAHTGATPGRVVRGPGYDACIDNNF